MQSLNWYVNRLSRMGPMEVAWRACAMARDAADRARVPLRLYPVPSGKAGFDLGVPGFRVSDVAPGGWTTPAASASERSWARSLCGRADALLENRFTFFNLRDTFLGDPVDWNSEAESGRRAPMRFAAAIDYRDYLTVGDAKVVWEPNRHQHLVVLARAYRASGRPVYAQTVQRHLASWLQQSPFGYGMNWRSPLELAIRLINWVWALDMIREGSALEPHFQRAVQNSAYLHLWEITRKFSRGSSANNHLIGEAAGVFIGASYFSHFREATRWRGRAHAILTEQALAQTLSDGSGAEHAPHYQFFVLQFLVLAGLVGSWTNMPFPPEYWDRIAAACEFLGRISEAGDVLPYLGDSDDGYVLDLGERRDLRGWLAACAILSHRQELSRWSGPLPETTRWLVGQAGAEQYAHRRSPYPEELRPFAFPESGYYLLQAGSNRNQSISALFDCADLGFGALAAHGHADALSFTLRIGGHEVLVDPGTYDYFRYPEWRSYFRSTRAHNTVTIDGLDQSEMIGPFMWGQRAKARCTAWDPTPVGGRVTGEHDGYSRLADPVLHRRTLEMDAAKGLLVVTDILEAAGQHDAIVAFHFSESCIVRLRDTHIVEATAGDHIVTLSFDPGTDVQLLHGSDEPRGGWVSRAYHDRRPATSVFAVARTSEISTIVTTIRVEWGGGQG